MVLYDSMIPYIIEKFADGLSQARNAVVKVETYNLKKFKSGNFTLGASDTKITMTITADKPMLPIGICVRKSSDDSIMTGTINRVTVNGDNILESWNNGDDLLVPLNPINEGVSIEIEFEVPSAPGSDTDIYIEIERLGLKIS